MAAYLLYFRLRGADRFGRIHGDRVSAAARADLDRRFSILARHLLGQHCVLSEPESPAFGLWLTPFELSPLEIEAGESEQLEAIVRAGRELGRTLLETELGSAVALHTPLEVGTMKSDGTSADLASCRERIGALPEPPPPPPAARGAEERRALLGIAARPMEIRLQTIVSLETRGPVAYEALARGPAGSRWRDPESLFEAAVRAGLRAEVELACLESALELVRRLPPSLRLAINLSPDLFGAPSVQRLAGVPGLPERLIFEVTEHLPIPAPASLLRQIERLRGNGAKLALDDAGCGYLNMELVRALKPDIVKLCITLTRRIGGGPEILEQIRKTVAAIRAEGAEALAEGVESETQARLARECGCALAQGFLFDEPRTPSEALAEAAGEAAAL